MKASAIRAALEHRRDWPAAFGRLKSRGRVRQLDPQLSGIITDVVIRAGAKFAEPYGRPEELIPFEIRTNAEGVAT